MKITIIGKGRLGRSLHALFSNRGMETVLLGRSPTLPDEADGVLLAVPDYAIEEAAASLRTGAPVLHCSGAIDWRVLRPHQPAGRFHPLMTFPGPELSLPDMADVPIAIDGDPEAVDLAVQIAERILATPLHIPGDPRLYHCAAVMAGNHTTVLFQEACRILEKAGIPADQTGAFLKPLALAAIRNAATDPGRALTGPIVRGDTSTLEQHRDALMEKGADATRILYDAITEFAQSRVDNSISSAMIRKEQ